MTTYVVQQGDNLTHIARRFGVNHWREIYEHPRNAEFRRKRPNPNLIYPGDVLHIPGQDEPTPVLDLGETIITIPADPEEPIEDLPDDQREKLLDEARDELPEDWKHWADGALKWVSRGLTVGQLAELMTLVGAGAWAMGSPVVLAIRSVLAWGSAWEVNERMYGFRGAAYTTTAWAFGKPRPTESPEMMRRFRQFSSADEIRRRRRAWQKASRRTWQHWETAYHKEKVSKEAMQAAVQMEGIIEAENSLGSPAEKLCLVLLKSFESEFRAGMNRESWREGYSVLYPR